MMDSTEGSSVNIPVSYNKSGELDMRYSRVMTTDEFDKLGEYVDKENVNNAGKILNGSININPYIKGNENSCTYCQFLCYILHYRYTFLYCYALYYCCTLHRCYSHLLISIYLLCLNWKVFDNLYPAYLC